MMTWAARTLALAALLALGACRVGGVASVSALNDELRAKNLELAREVESLKGEREELRVKLAASERVRRDALPPDVAEAIPRCVGIEIGSLTGFDAEPAGSPLRSATAYISPRDGRDRFVPMVGTLHVQVSALPPTVEAGLTPTGGLENVVLSSATVRVGPAELREAYRSGGFFGSAYEIKVRLEPAVADRGAKLLVRAEYLDALTGATHTAERVITPVVRVK